MTLLGPRRFHLAMAALAGASALPAVVGWRDIHVLLAHWVAHALVVGSLLLVGAAASRWIPRVGDALAAGAWGIAYNACTSPTSYVAMRGSTPMRDGLLARFDAGIGLSGPAVRAALSFLPQATWWRIYDLLIPLLVTALLVVPLSGRRVRTRRLLTAYGLSFLLTLPVLLSVHAEGPWSVYGWSPAPTQADYVRELAALQAAGPFTFDPTRTTGVVTFPSFHTLLAALGGWALAPVRWVGPLAIAVATGIVLATVATGWHYAADVVAGLLFAAASVRLAGRLEAAWESEGAPARDVDPPARSA